jgi:hypothetical protein
MRGAPASVDSKCSLLKSSRTNRRVPPSLRFDTSAEESQFKVRLRKIGIFGLFDLSVTTSVSVANVASGGTWRPHRFSYPIYVAYHDPFESLASFGAFHTTTDAPKIRLGLPMASFGAFHTTTKIPQIRHRLPLASFGATANQRHSPPCSLPPTAYYLLFTAQITTGFVRRHRQSAPFAPCCLLPTIHGFVRRFSHNNSRPKKSSRFATGFVRAFNAATKFLLRYVTSLQVATARNRSRWQSWLANGFIFRDHWRRRRAESSQSGGSIVWFHWSLPGVVSRLPRATRLYP